MKKKNRYELMLKRFVKLRKKNLPFFYKDNDLAFVDICQLETEAEKRGLLS